MSGLLLGHPSAGQPLYVCCGQRSPIPANQSSLRVVAGQARTMCDQTTNTNSRLSTSVVECHLFATRTTPAASNDAILRLIVKECRPVSCGGDGSGWFD